MDEDALKRLEMLKLISILRQAIKRAKAFDASFNAMRQADIGFIKNYLAEIDAKEATENV